jgi:hypothetical protein
MVRADQPFIGPIIKIIAHAPHARVVLNKNWRPPSLMTAPICLRLRR